MSSDLAPPTTKPKHESYRQQGWEVRACSLCEKQVPTKEVLHILPHVEAKDLEALVKNASPSSEENWRWCRGCNSGVLCASDLDMMTCANFMSKPASNIKFYGMKDSPVIGMTSSTMGRMAIINEDLIKTT